MKKIITILLLVFASASYGQVRYWIFFTDKPLAEQQLQHANQFLSERSLNRRLQQNIALNASDMPLHQAYVEAVQQEGITVLQQSKWLNGISVFATKAQIEDLKKYNFIRKVKPVLKLVKHQKDLLLAEMETFKTAVTSYNYGGSGNQITMMNGQFLHDQNYRGQGMLIAQLDGGFSGADVLPAFDSLWARGGVLLTRDFVDGDTNVFHGGSHGMSVLSIMAGNLPGQLIGSAPLADYLLLKSENEASETTIEEDNWVAAAELADSLGANIINSSLGYSTFDGAIGNYTWDDLDGRTATTSIAAVMAARKGILVVNSAGNEGLNSWTKVIAPADADSILAVGGVNAQGMHVQFSSNGPTADGRIKPDISAQGSAVICSLLGGAIAPGNGTSYAAPLVSGLSACFWQMHPTASAMQIRETIIASAHLYLSPDNFYGHGIPNFLSASNIFSTSDNAKLNLDDCNLMPNPFLHDIVLTSSFANYPVQVKITVIDEAGRTISSDSIQVDSPKIELKGFEDLAPGMYIFSLEFNGVQKQIKMQR